MVHTQTEATLGNVNTGRLYNCASIVDEMLMSVMLPMFLFTCCLRHGVQPTCTVAAPWPGTPSSRSCLRTFRSLPSGDPRT